MATSTQKQNSAGKKATQSSSSARTGRRELLPLTVVLAELGDEHGPLARSTFDDWRARGVAPKVIKLPNGQLRIDRVDLNAWIDSRVQSPAA
ncbi:helix-turn-helix transcriptional regulator [Candidatus Frankia nodulisporulans]|uniref:helix-turn-helix transcriptional regulator n=1 Tax=Candidatus Frankia nodulisporulans TaxID=2060052 RepID=UPI001C2E01DE|nr:DNA-binding protein [Candidatus Frankia nodulisporulans]